ncbi:MAG: hypothetical protein NVSMB5_14890 [Candidatus Velthaea sp.]
MNLVRAIAVLSLSVVVSACSNGSTTAPLPSPVVPSSPVPLPLPSGSIASLATITTIGSTIDVGTGAGKGDQNPYGLTIAPVTAGLITAGDLLVCNFNDAANVQGNGTTIEDLKPVAGSVPARIIQDSRLQGCNALASAPNGNIWAADYTANNNPIVSPSGTINTTLSQNAWAGPWGQAFNAGTGGKPSFFVTNAKNGTVVRINIMPGPTFSFDTILSGLTYNSGVPGNILAPAGLTYDKTNDTLYIVDSNANRVIKIVQATLAPANTYAATGSTFNSPNVAVVLAGAPLAAPISSAQLANGDLVVGNTANNLLVEINPITGKAVATRSLDTGAAGALFGIAATTVGGAQYVYFNDGNDNTVKLLAP